MEDLEKVLMDKVLETAMASLAVAAAGKAETRIIQQLLHVMPLVALAMLVHR